MTASLRERRQFWPRLLAVLRARSEWAESSDVEVAGEIAKATADTRPSARVVNMATLIEELGAVRARPIVAALQARAAVDPLLAEVLAIMRAGEGVQLGAAAIWPTFKAALSSLEAVACVALAFEKPTGGPALGLCRDVTEADVTHARRLIDGKRRPSRRKAQRPEKTAE